MTMADVYIPRLDEAQALRALEHGACVQGYRTDDDKIAGRVARRLIAMGYAIRAADRVVITGAGRAALRRCS